MRRSADQNGLHLVAVMPMTVDESLGTPVQDPNLPKLARSLPLIAAW